MQRSLPTCTDRCKVEPPPRKSDRCTRAATCASNRVSLLNHHKYRFDSEAVQHAPLLSSLSSYVADPKQKLKLRDQLCPRLLPGTDVTGVMRDFPSIRKQDDVGVITPTTTTTLGSLFFPLHAAALPVSLCTVTAVSSGRINAWLDPITAQDATAPS